MNSIEITPEKMFCPFRKASYHLIQDNSKEYLVPYQEATHKKEEFLPCMGKKCMAYMEYEYEGQLCFECGLVNKNQEGA